MMCCDGGLRGAKIEKPRRGLQSHSGGGGCLLSRDEGRKGLLGHVRAVSGVGRGRGREGRRVKKWVVLSDMCLFLNKCGLYVCFCGGLKVIHKMKKCVCFLKKERLIAGYPCRYVRDGRKKTNPKSLHFSLYFLNFSDKRIGVATLGGGLGGFPFGRKN